MATSDMLVRRRRPVNNYKLAYGMGVNWVDLDKKRIYMIQEYKEKMDDPSIPKDQKPKKIRVMDLDGKTEIGWEIPEVVEERMKDPEPDPKYAYDPPRKGKW